jgi:predicted DNA-binding protein (MmcQ/YjbR family)
MNLTTLRELCLSFPGATEQIQWGADLVFKVGGRMFCVACTEVAPNVMSFKCDDERFAELCERDGIIPAPYMARAKWVALERWDTLEDRELTPLVEQAYVLIRQKLPRKTQAGLDGTSRPTVRVGGAGGAGKAGGVGRARTAKWKATAARTRVVGKSRKASKRSARTARRK